MRKKVVKLHRDSGSFVLNLMKIIHVLHLKTNTFSTKDVISKAKINFKLKIHFDMVHFKIFQLLQ
jgi:hypothetical protein